jgi:hypothetical protein
MQYTDLETQQSFLINQSNLEIQELFTDLKTFYQNQDYEFSTLENQIFFDIQNLIQVLQAKTIIRSDLPKGIKKLYYHNSRHNLALAKRTLKIIKVLKLDLKLSYRLLLQVFFHDSILRKGEFTVKETIINREHFQYFTNQSDPDNEMKSAQNLAKHLKELNQKWESKYFSDLEIESDQKAILNTAVDFENTLKTVKTVAFSDLKDLKLNQILLHLVDLGGAGIGKYDQNGDLVSNFASEGDNNLLEDVIIPTLLHENLILDDKIRVDLIPDRLKFIVAYKILTWSEGQIAFAKGQKILLNQILEALEKNGELSISQIQILESQVFNAFEISQNIASQKAQQREELFQDFNQKYQQKKAGKQDLDLNPCFEKLLVDVGLKL